MIRSNNGKSSRFHGLHEQFGLIIGPFHCIDEPEEGLFRFTLAYYPETSSSPEGGHVGHRWFTNWMTGLARVGADSIDITSESGRVYRFYSEDRDWKLDPCSFSSDATLGTTESGMWLFITAGVAYEFNPDGVLHSVSSGGGTSVIHLMYEAEKLVYLWEITSGRQIFLEYDGNLLTVVREARKRPTYLYYDKYNNLSQIASSNGDFWEFFYLHPDIHFLSAITDPDGNVHLYLNGSEKGLFEDTPPRKETGEVVPTFEGALEAMELEPDSTFYDWTTCYDHEVNWVGENVYKEFFPVQYRNPEPSLEYDRNGDLISVTESPLEGDIHFCYEEAGQTPFLPQAASKRCRVASKREPATPRRRDGVPVDSAIAPFVRRRVSPRNSRRSDFTTRMALRLHKTPAASS